MKLLTRVICRILLLAAMMGLLVGQCGPAGILIWFLVAGYLIFDANKEQEKRKTDALRNQKLRRIYAKTLLALALFPLCTSTHAGTFQWNANAETDIQYYRLYVGTNSGIYTASYLSLGTGTNLTVANSLFVIGRTNYAAITAVNTSGQESKLSDQIAFVITNGPPGSVTGLRYIGQ